MRAIHRFSVVIPDSAIDANGHANNVEYVCWMQQAAISHSDFTGCTRATISSGSSWVVRSHHVEYLRPAFAGDAIVVLTWVSTIKKASSLRKYVFIRKSDRAVVARGQTIWVFVDSPTGRPKVIPREVSSVFKVLPVEEEASDWK